MTKAKRWAARVVFVIVVAAGAAWYYQSAIIGAAAEMHLQGIASEEERSGDLTQRRYAIAQVHRQLLMAPPLDAMVPELFDFLTQLSSRVATGEVSLAWGAYLYTSHLRDIVARPDTASRPSAEQLAAKIQEGIDFFYLQKRPDVPGMQVKDLWDDGESYTVEEIEQAAREGRDLTREE